MIPKTNFYKQPCAICRKAIEPEKGYVSSENGKWLAYCIPHWPHKIEPLRRRLYYDGVLVYENPTKNELNLIRSIPGIWWDEEYNYWRVSSRRGDRRRVLEIAEKLKTEIDPEFKEFKLTEEALAGEKAGLYPFQVIGTDFLSSKTHAFLGDPMGLGKMLDLSTLLATPNGWCKAGDLKVGDELIGQNGRPCKILNLYKNKNRDFYRLTFGDKTKIYACEDHLWSVLSKDQAYRIRKQKSKVEISDYKILSTKELFSKKIVQVNKKGKGKNYNYHIPCVEPVQYERKDFPIDPYILGVYLGEGSSSDSAVTFSINENDQEIIDSINSFFSENITLSKKFIKDLNRKSKATRIYVKADERKKFLEKLKYLKLINKKSVGKFIPEIYKFGSIEQRWNLLCGLMDADGTLSTKSNKGNSLSFGSSSYKLVHGIRELVLSLGGIARIGKPEYKSYNLNGSKARTKNASWRVGIKLPDNKAPFTIPRQLEKYVPFEKYDKPYKNIESIEYIGRRDGVCFEVDEPNHLYVAQHYIVTHNTVETICAFSRSQARILCIVPACVKYNWSEEIQKWRPDLEVKVINGRGNFEWPKLNQVVIINFDILPERFIPEKDKKNKYIEHLSGYTKEDLESAAETIVVIDEAHKVKNGKTKQASKIRTLTKVTKKVWALSGTPLLNRPHDLWGMLYNLNFSKEVFGTFTRFKELFNAYQGRFGIVWGKPHPIVPELLRRIMLRRNRADVLPDLPQKTYTTYTVESIPKALIKELNTTFEDWLPVLLTEDKLPAFEHFAEIRKKLALSRIPAMLEYITECEDQEVPLLVFSAHREPVLEAAKREGWLAITGTTSAKKRQEIVKKFQAGELKGVALTIQAGGVGLTLTRAWKVLFVDLDWTPSNNAQAEDRVCRIGQTANKIEIIRMVSNHSLDQHIMKLIDAKMKLIHQSIEASIKVGDNPQRGETEEEYKKRLEKIQDTLNEKEKEDEAHQFRLAKSRVKSYTPILKERSEKREKKEIVFDLVLKEEVRHAFEYMTDVCDGAKIKDGHGFNRPDSAIAKYIKVFGVENDEGCEAAYYLLRGYKKQLKQKFPKLFRKPRKKKS